MKKILILMLSITLLFTACKKKQDTKDALKPETVKTEEVAEQKVETVENDSFDDTVINEDALSSDEVKVDKIEQWNKEEVLEDVYFGFDKSTLTAESREVLAKHAKWLKEHSDINVVIEGHCDERGTEQYNMALGDRRANAVKNYLISLGVPDYRLKTRSFGEMFPKVKEHNEWAWAQNRRAHFVLKKGN